MDWIKLSTERTKPLNSDRILQYDAKPTLSITEAAPQSKQEDNRHSTELQRCTFLFLLSLKLTNISPTSCQHEKDKTHLSYVATTHPRAFFYSSSLAASMALVAAAAAELEADLAISSA